MLAMHWLLEGKSCSVPLHMEPESVLKFYSKKALQGSLFPHL